MSNRVTNIVWNMMLPPIDKLVLVRLGDFADEDGRDIYPSVRTVADLCGLNKRTVQVVLRKYLDAGLLVIEAEFDAGKKLANRYRIVLEVAMSWPKIRRILDASGNSAGGHTSKTGGVDSPVEGVTSPTRGVDSPVAQHHTNLNLLKEDSKKRERHVPCTKGERKGSNGTKTDPADWERFRAAYPSRGPGNTMGWSEAEDRFKALIRKGLATADQLIAAAGLYAEAVATIKDRQMIQQAATFLGPRKQTWREYLEMAQEPKVNRAEAEEWARQRRIAVLGRDYA